MSSQLRLSGARIILADGFIDGTVVSENGIIVAVDEGRSVRPGAEDLEGDLLLPGLIEIHTDNIEKHLCPRPGVEWPAASAVLAHDGQVASAGITTVLDALCIGDVPGRDWRAIAEAVVPTIKALQGTGHLRADHLLHLRCEVTAPNLESEVAPYLENDLLRLVSVMDHTPGQRQFPDLQRYIDMQRGYGHPDERIHQDLAVGAERQSKFASRHRRWLAERCVALGVPVASHDDETPTHVDDARALGMTISEFPTTRAAAEAARECGLATVLGAPNIVRGGSHSGNVSALALARAGLLDILSSDYMPISLLHAAFKLVDVAGIALPAAIATVTSAPAKALGLRDRGGIAPGLRADLVRVSPSDHGPVVRAVWRQGMRVA